MTRTVVCLTLICLLIGCAGSSVPPTTPQQTEPGAIVIAELPAPSLLGKLAAASAGVNGADFITAVPPLHVVEDGTAAVYSPSYIGGGSGVNDLAMAFYTIATGGFDEGLRVSLTWTTAPATEDIWLAAADYMHDTWSWHQANDDGTIAVSDRTRHTLEDGTFPVIVAVGGIAQCRLEQITVEDYALPAAVLATDPAPATGDPPLVVAFDASGSTSSNGAIVAYSWDLDGNGTFGEHQKPEGAYDGQAQANLTYTVAQLTMAMVRVTDELGFSSEAAVSINAQGLSFDNASLQPLLAIDESAFNVVVMEIAGMPAIFIRAKKDAAFEGRLLYTRATSLSPLTWGPVNVLDGGDGSFPGMYLTAQLIDGKPAAAYLQMGGTPALRYVYAQDELGTNWNPAVTVMPSGDPRSLAVVEGKPALAGYVTSLSPRGLYFALANDTTGSSWDSPVLVEPLPDLLGSWGERAALCGVQGKPAVAFRAVDESTEPDAHEIRYCLASDPGGTAWGAAVAVDHEDLTNTSLYLGEDIALFNSGTGPSITYSRIRRSVMGLLMEGDLYQADAMDAGGDAWGAPHNPFTGSLKTTSYDAPPGELSDFGWLGYNLSLTPLEGAEDYLLFGNIYVDGAGNGTLELSQTRKADKHRTYGVISLGKADSFEFDYGEVVVEKSPFGPPYFVQLRAAVYVLVYHGDDYEVKKFTWPLQSFYSNE